MSSGGHGRVYLEEITHALVKVKCWDKKSTTYFEKRR